MAEFTITSDTLATASSLKSLYNFLSDFGNFKAIMPEDKVEGFVHDENSCSFNIRGVTPLKVKFKEKHAYSKIIFESEGLAKFNFLLEATFKGEAELPGQCTIQLHGDINPIIRSFAEKPLSHLVNTMAIKLAALTIES